MTILLLFFFSGATALVYEVIWSKYLALLFGSTIQAQTVVLAVFMGGLALGNKLFSRRADGARQQLGIYGIIEITIGIYALLFSLIYRVADTMFASAGSILLEHNCWLLLLKGSISIALLGIPTVLMGGTLPMLAAWLQKSTSDAARRSARFYSVNSLGAVLGAGLTGFVLVPELGMPATMKLAAVVNIVIGVIAIVIGRKQITASAEIRHEQSEPLRPAGNISVFRWGCVLVSLTGAVSMGLEVLASRCLCLLFGASLQVFAIVLMAFILGIGLGSSVIASPRRKQGSSRNITIVLLLGASALIGLLVFNIENLGSIYRYARSGLAPSSVGYRYYQVLASVASICVLGLPAAALGAVLPLWIRAMSETSDQLGNRVGRLLTWNTLGAVGGVLLTGFILMPNIGLRASFAVLAIVLAIAAVLTAVSLQRQVVAGVGSLVVVLLLLVTATGGETWRFMFSSGVFRQHDTDATLSLPYDRHEAVDMLFYEDAADATVSVERWKNQTNEITLRINGKPDASSVGDRPTQTLIAELPLIVRPESKDVFCFGMGSGITAGTVLNYPIEHLTVADNCEPVLRAAKLFDRWNNGLFDDKRVHIYREDARTVLKLNPQKYDIILSEPSNPWMVGVGSVFSQEFYQVVTNRLKPDGIMSQWFHTYEMDDDTIALVMRTFATVFPAMEIWDIGDGDILMLGSAHAWESNPDVYQRAFALEGPRRNLMEMGIAAPEAVLGRQVASQRTAFAIAGPGPIQSDGHPILEYKAPRAFYISLARGTERLQRFDERTWQVDFAPLLKNRTLSSLGLTDLKALIRPPCSLMNNQLHAYLNVLLGEQNNSQQQLSIESMPCIFRGTNTAVVFMPLSAKTNEVSRQLVLAESALQSHPRNWGPAIDYIKSVLDAMSTNQLPDPGRSAGYYADLAVKAALHLGKTELVKSILLRGLKLEPNSDQLRYDARILLREKVIQPEDISFLSQK